MLLRKKKVIDTNILTDKRKSYIYICLIVLLLNFESKVFDRYVFLLDS